MNVKEKTCKKNENIFERWSNLYKTVVPWRYKLTEIIKDLVDLRYDEAYLATSRYS